MTVAAVYAPVLVELVRDWLRDPNYSHGLLVPVISAVLLWQRRDAFAGCTSRGAWLGVCGVLAAGGMLALGTAGAEVFTQRVSLVAVLASLCLAFGGWTGLRLGAFPIAFLLLAIPLPYVIYYDLTGPLQSIAAQSALFGIQLVGIPAVAEGNVIHLPETSLEVAEACSGIRSLYAFLALGALFARSMPIPSWGRVLVFLATIPLSVVGNAFRVWGTAMAAYLVGPEAATGTAHELFGLVVFVVALVILGLIGKGARRLWQVAPSSSS